MTNPDKVGIGGSETSHIELTWRLAARGYDVTSYAPLKSHTAMKWRSSTWRHFEDCDYSQPGLWIIYRNPAELDNFPEEHPGQKLIFMAQDTYYKDATAERYAKLDSFLCLCPDHQHQVSLEWPTLKDKIYLTGNGLKPELVKQVLSERIPRNPRKVIFVSSPDRGIKNAAAIIDRVIEYYPEIELHTYYGLDNLKTMFTSEHKGTAYVSARIVKDIEDFLKTKKGVIQHGRLPQPELYREIASAGLLLYPTTFKETGAICPSMECPALGAIPITNPIWALRTNVTSGIFVQGNVDSDILVRARYAGEVLRMVSDDGVKLQEAIRPAMMAQALERFSWERRVDELVDLFSQLESKVAEEVMA